MPTQETGDEANTDEANTQSHRVDEATVSRCCCEVVRYVCQLPVSHALSWTYAWVMPQSCVDVI